jgi:hypothetical protein
MSTTIWMNRPNAEPYLDFSTSAEVVRVVVEGERLGAGHLFNPAFATETALIDPLPHQRIAVYDHMLVQTRLRFLLADDAGAGKTIMSGLYIREMLTRRLIRRVLIIPPAGLLGNWERELRLLFSLPFRVVGGSEARSGNPFIGTESDLLIVSVDTLAGERMFGRLQELVVEPYDLVIFDEAHKLAADREPDYSIRKTDRYRLGEALSGIVADDARWQLPWSAHHLLWACCPTSQASSPSSLRQHCGLAIGVEGPCAGLEIGCLIAIGVRARDGGPQLREHRAGHMPVERREERGLVPGAAHRAREMVTSLRMHHWSACEGW